MPKLNRFRVVNLVYNDTRHIYDEIFEFDKGMDTLLLLDNGGGKTVLTQMMMQPVIPKTDLKSRKFIDYFKNNPRPTLLISEWLLDDGAGRLLTGLVVQNVKRRRAGDVMEDLQIVTFVIEVSGHEVYGIDNLPVATSSGNGPRLMRSMEEIVKDLERQAVKFPYYVQLFKWSDSKQAKDDYRSRMRQYGIVDSEWKENILRINQEESGLKDFFNDAKRSSTLIEKKFLPIIESRLDEKNGESLELTGMVEAHVKELVKYDEIIKEDKIYRSFLGESIQYRELLLTAHEAGRALEASYGDHMAEEVSLEGLKLDVDGEIRECLSKMEDIEAGKRLIAIEEASYEYYEGEDDLAKRVDSLDNMKRMLESLDHQAQRTKEELNLEKGRVLYQNLQETQAMISLKEEQIAFSANEEDLGRLERLEAILAYKYQEGLDDFERQITQQEDGIKSLEALTGQKEEQIKSLEVEVEGIRKLLEEGNFQIKTYENVIDQMNAKYPDQVWERHGMFGTYEKERLSQLKADCEQEVNQAHEDIQALEALMKAEQQQLLDNQNRLANGKIDQNNLIHQKAESEKALEAYERAYAKQVDDLMKKGLIEDSRKIFDGTRMEQIFASALLEVERAINEAQLDEAMKLQLSTNLKEGRLSGIPEVVEAYLNKHQVDFQYGYRWLREYQGETLEPSVYLKYLPLLPYALMMTEADWLKLQADPIQEAISVPVAVVTYEAVSQVLDDIRDREVQSDGVDPMDLEVSSAFITGFDRGLLEAHYITDKIGDLDKDVADIIEALEHLRQSYQEISSLKASYQVFSQTYDGSSGHRLLQELQKVQIQIDALKEKMTLISEENKMLEKTIVDREADLKSHKSILESLEGHLEILAKLQEDFGVYDKARDDMTKYQRQQEQMIKEQIQLRAEIKSCDEQITEIRILLSRVNREMEALSLKARSLLAKYNHLSLENLQAYEEWTDDVYTVFELKLETVNQQLKDLESARELIKVYYNNLRSSQEALDQLGIANKAYEEGAPNPAKVAEKEALLETLIEDKQQQSNELAKQEGQLESRREQLDQDLKKIYRSYDIDQLPSRREIVDLNFRQRSRDLTASGKKVLELQKAFQRLRNGIDEMVTAMKQYEIPADLRRQWQEVQESSEELNLARSYKVPQGSKKHVESIDLLTLQMKESVNEHLGQLKDQKKQLEVKKAEVRNFYLKLKGQHRASHNLVGRMFDQLLSDDRCDEYHHVLSVLEGTEKSIQMTMDKYAADIEKIDDKERTIQDMISQRVSDAYDELREMDKHSKIELGGGRRQMLFIGLTKKELIAFDELHVYIREVIGHAKKLWMDQDRLGMEKYLGESLSLRKLFDTYHPISGIKVELTKIEKNQLSKISWEQVAKISGGEGFVSIFVVFITMLSYSRGYQLGRKQQGKVLVMDNPFGPVSSEHLLDPLFQIAKNYNTQMICFTHLGSTSITRQFPKVYALRVVKEMGSVSEHIEVSVADDLKVRQEYVEASPFEIGDGGQIGLF